MYTCDHHHRHTIVMMHTAPFSDGCEQQNKANAQISSATVLQLVLANNSHPHQHRNTCIHIHSTIMMTTFTVTMIMTMITTLRSQISVYK